MLGALIHGFHPPEEGGMTACRLRWRGWVIVFDAEPAL